MPRDTFWLLTLNLIYGPTFALIIKWQSKILLYVLFMKLSQIVKFAVKEKVIKLFRLKIII